MSEQQVAERREARHAKQSPSGDKARKVGKLLLKIGAFVGTFVLALVVAAAGILGSICADAYPSAQQVFVSTILETGQLKFLASIFVSQDKIGEIVQQNSMESLNEQIDTDMIVVGNPDTPNTEQKDIEIIEVSGGTYTGTMMIVKDPARIELATIFPWREQGVTLDKLVNDNGAIAGINGGLYDSKNNSGGRPYGVIVSKGEIQHNKPQEYKGLVLVGFTEEHILQIIDLSGMSASDVERLVKEKKMRDAVTFQEEMSRDNNHFVQLIINGSIREVSGMGSGLNPRTAIGQRADGSVLLFVTDGRGKSGHLGASASDLIAVMQEYGAVNAANLDGGSSSCMYYDGKYLKSSVTFYYDNSSWRLPAGFIVK